MTVPAIAHHSLAGSTSILPQLLQQLISEFATVRIEPPPPPTEASPVERSLLAELPEEILSQILQSLAIKDVAAFVRMSLVCKRLAYLVLTEEAIWKRVALGKEFGFAAMHYDFVCDIEGSLLEANDEIARYLGFEDDDELANPAASLPLVPEDHTCAFTALTESLLRTTYASS